MHGRHRGALLLSLLTTLCDASRDGSNCPPGGLVARERMPLRTQAGAVVDKNACPVRFACVNWYGAHMELFSVDGLSKQPLETIAARIAQLGFNCVRLPFSLQLLRDDPLVPDLALAANPELRGIRGVELFDRTVAALTDVGLMVILNNHNSAAGWCCSGDSPEGIWHTDEYPIGVWYDSISHMAARFRANTLVVAFDIRNEIHDVGPVKLTWGTSDDERVDWRVASTKAAALMQTANPSMLVIVTGMCYGLDLRAMRRRPPDVARADKLVFTSHTYDFSLWWNVAKFQLRLPGLDGKRGGEGAWHRFGPRALAAGLVVMGTGAVAVGAWGAGAYGCGAGGACGGWRRACSRWQLAVMAGFWLLAAPGLVVVAGAAAWREAMTEAQCDIAAGESAKALFPGVAAAAAGLGVMLAACCGQRRAARQIKRGGDGGWGGTAGGASAGEDGEGDEACVRLTHAPADVVGGDGGSNGR